MVENIAAKLDYQPGQEVIYGASQMKAIIRKVDGQKVTLLVHGSHLITVSRIRIRPVTK